MDSRTTTLPEKPKSVAHVSDVLWEAALRQAHSTWWNIPLSFNDVVEYTELIDHARCLILLGEVVEPVDRLDAAIERLVDELYSASRDPKSIPDLIRKHLAGLTIPGIDQ